MIQLFDFFGQAEIPSILLCNPNQDELFSLSSLIYDDKLTFRFNALSEYEFNIPKSIDGGETVLDCYDFIQSKRLIKIENIGYFVIAATDELFDGSQPYKRVSCRSIDGEMISRKISSFSGTYKFYDPTHTTTNLIDTILEMIPSWSVGTIDSVIRDRYRTFNITDMTIYSFLMTNVEKSYQCIFSFDLVNKRINAYSVDNATTNTDIFLSFDNLVKKANFKTMADEVVTAMKVYGGNELSIRSVNPLGGNTIYNFDYYLNTDWMSSGLKTAVDNWKLAVDAAQPTYATDLALLKIANQELLDLMYDPDTGLQKLMTDLAALKALQQAAVTAVPVDPVEVEDIAVQIENKTAEIDAKQVEIDAKEADIGGLIGVMQTINDSLSFENNFTTEEYEELTLFIFENTYVNETIVATDSMTAVEYQDASQTLYDQAIVVLEKASQPRYEFSVDAANFIEIQDFARFTNQLIMGAVVTVNISENYNVSTYLLEMNRSFKNPESFSVVFSNRLRLVDGSFQYSDLIQQANDTGNRVGINELVWEDWSINYKDTVSLFINSALNATTNQIINSTNQEMTIDTYGLRGRKYISPGIYDGKEMWLTNNILAFTDDNWMSSKLALGTIETAGGTFSGLIADSVIGRMLAGNSLTITNDDGIVTRTFTLDQNGAVLQNADLTVENSQTRILISPENGIKVQQNSSSHAGSVIQGNTSTGTASPGSVISWTHTVAYGSNRILIVAATLRANQSVSSVTFGSYSLVRRGYVFTGSGGDVPRVEIWYLINPVVGWDTITVTCTGSEFVQCAATDFSNVSVTSPFHNFSTTQGTGTSASIPVYGATGDLFVSAISCAGATISFSSGETSLWYASSDGNWKMQGGRKAATSSSTMSYSLSTSTNYAMAAFTLKRYDAGPIWTDVFYADESGNVNFAGVLSGASGSFSGEISAASGNIGTLIINDTGLVGENDLAFGIVVRTDGSTDFRAGNFVTTRDSTGADTWMNFNGSLAEILATDGIEFTSGADINFTLSGNLNVNGGTGVSGTIDTTTYTNLTFTNGILTGYA